MVGHSIEPMDRRVESRIVDITARGGIMLSLHTLMGDGSIMDAAFGNTP